MSAIINRCAWSILYHHECDADNGPTEVWVNHMPDSPILELAKEDAGVVIREMHRYIYDDMRRRLDSGEEPLLALKNCIEAAFGTDSS